MERSCRVMQVCDKSWVDPKLDSLYRSAAIGAKVWRLAKSIFFKLNMFCFVCYHFLILILEVGVHELDTILYIDCTKLGVLSQANVNMIGEVSERILFRAPSRYLVIASSFFFLFSEIIS